ncbi:MAG: lysylphosphatidylglycerol synthase domain-containing protein, partial [Burkholderiales bacterium]|nr:lysylphosphatidylglycerol synthase domain-containing protein [Burkholderiales bacterium]
WLGIGCMLIAVSYLLLPVLRKDPLMVRGFQMKMPSVPLAVGQLVLSILEWILAAAVLFILLPEGGPSYGALLGAFLAAQVIGIISHVPGGIGVFEGIMVLLLAPYLPSDDSITALLLYRLIYYVVPLVLALLILVGDELRNHRARFRPRGKSMGD